MLHLTYHAKLCLTTRTSLTLDDAVQAFDQGLDLPHMPKSIQSYITNRLIDYHNDKCSPLYRLYKDIILVYRPNTFKDTKSIRPYALITVLPLPDYLTLLVNRANMT